MKPAKILMPAAACLLLTACDDWSGAGAVRLEAPQAMFSQPCARPEGFLRASDWELVAGRLGDALIDCEAKRAGLDGWAEGVIKAAGPR